VSLPHPTSPHRSLHLNPNTVAPLRWGEETPNWQRFSPSSLVGWSPALCQPSSVSLMTSFADVVHGKGKAPMEASDPSSSMGSSRYGCAEAACTNVVYSSFMVGARQAGLGHQAPLSHPEANGEGWQLVIRRKQWRHIS
jgi:hypothetical protein